MGGSAFSDRLPPNAFPRMPSAVYNKLKEELLPKLKELYTYVGVPFEAPEKADHGDLDFLVTAPIGTNFVPHEKIVETIGAKHVVPMSGFRTSNFAVPFQPKDWQDAGHGAEEEERRQLAEDRQIFYQVDVHVCEDANEWERTMFFHSYGDLGMILGLIVRNNGLRLGVHGLKLKDNPFPPLILSKSFDNITSFLGLSMETYHKGFQTRQEVFKWATSCKYFNHLQFQTRGEGITKVKQGRRMYHEFTEWVEESRPIFAESQQDDLPHWERFAKAQEDALLFFDKRDEYEDIIRARTSKQRFKESFNSSQIRQWAGLNDGDWESVKRIMNKIKQDLGGEAGILSFLDDHGEEELEEMVVKVKDELGNVSREDAVDSEMTDDRQITLSLPVD